MLLNIESFANQNLTDKLQKIGLLAAASSTPANSLAGPSTRNRKDALNKVAAAPLSILKRAASEGEEEDGLEDKKVLMDDEL